VDESFGVAPFAILTPKDKRMSNWSGAGLFDPLPLPMPRLRPISKFWLLLATEEILEHLTPRGGDKYRSTVAKIHALSDVARAWGGKDGVLAWKL
jgi:hypothetical protein